jgi:hypothetical protein
MPHERGGRYLESAARLTRLGGLRMIGLPGSIKPALFRIGAKEGRLNGPEKIFGGPKMIFGAPEIKNGAPKIKNGGPKTISGGPEF